MREKIYFFVLIFGVLADNETYFETVSGKIITFDNFKQHVKFNTSFWCTGKFSPCDPKEGRRMDGSCNNLQYPTRGMTHTPYMTELPLIFDKGNEPVKMKTGEKIEPRRVRVDALSTGTVPDQQFTILLVHYLVLGFGNIGSLHDTVNYVLWTPYCCTPKGKNDSMCYPIKVPADDIVHQFSDIRCFNNTRPLTYQTVGCIRDQNTTPQRLNSAGVFLDLSMIYGETDSFRSHKDGMLKVDKEDNKIWPVSGPAAGTCLLNQLPKETRCHAAQPLNSVFGLNFLGIIFWRNHNFIAERLKEFSPCWDDDKLFFTARDINIAQFVQIYYYEMTPLLIGRETLLKEGVISKNRDFRDIYKELMKPKQALEYTYVLRWLHTVQPGHLEMYDDAGNYLNKIKVTNTTFRTGYLPLDGHMEGLTQGSFRQPAAKFDYLVDPIISENGLPKLQRAFDIPAADLLKAGLFGLQPYIAYRQLCSGREYKTYDDLLEDVEPENIEIMKNSFKYVEDVPLMVGLWLEKKIPGGYVPRTYACLTMKQMKRFIEYDRHWYERPNRPNAFTKAQLYEIRKSTIARIFCDVGDSVTQIMPNAFLREGPRNRITNCTSIPALNFAAWQDTSCSA